MNLDQKFLYLGGCFDGTWRRPMTFDPTNDSPGPEQVRDESTLESWTYVATKLWHAADRGSFRMSMVIMLEHSLHSLVTQQSQLVDADFDRARQLERAILMRSLREHLQLTWRPEAAGLLDFGPAWAAMERRP